MDGVARRQAERELYDLKKTEQLQNDEIERLHLELEALLRQIANAEERVDGGEKYRRRIRELREELAVIPAQTSVRKSQMISAHTKRLNEIRTRHQREVDRLKSGYGRQMASRKLPEVDEVKDEMVASINTTRLKIAELLHLKSEQREVEVKAKLQKLSEQIERDRKRIEQLEQANDQLEQELAKAKAENDSKVTQMRLGIPDLNTSEEEEKLVLFQADLIREEDAFRKEAQKALDELKTKVSDQRQAVEHWKAVIDSYRSDTSDKLKQAEQEKEKLEIQSEAISLQRRARQEVRSASPPRTDIQKRDALVDKMQKTREVLFSAQHEHTALLTEIRRLNFMLYGRKLPPNLFKKYYIS